MQELWIHCDPSQSTQILTGTYFPPKGRHLNRASPGEFLSFLLAYLHLWLARQEAGDQQLGPHENSVPMSFFHSLGILDYVLLWMWYQGHVDYCLSAGLGDRSCNGHPSQASFLF